jgi:hypothetical protein
MITHSFRRSWSRPGETLGTTDVTVEAGAEINISEPIPADTADLLVACAIDVSQLKGLFMVASHDLTIETNSPSAPANTFTLYAGVPYMWIQGDAAIRDTSGTTVTTDITALYVTNISEAEEAMLHIRALVDPTV